MEVQVNPKKLENQIQRPLSSQVNFVLKASHIKIDLQKRVDVHFLLSAHQTSLKDICFFQL